MLKNKDLRSYTSPHNSPPNGKRSHSYDAYGNAIGFDQNNAKTEFLYNGEQFDSKIGQQYLRDRYYDPTNGRFNRLDPFFGNVYDPQSLHKYLYAHGDPINAYDPSGQMMAGIGVGIGMANSISSTKNSSDMAVLDSVKAVIAGIQAGMNPTQIFATIMLDQITGMVAGFGVGKIISGTKAVLTGGITIKMPTFKTGIKGFKVNAIQKGGSNAPLPGDAKLASRNVRPANYQPNQIKNRFQNPVQAQRAQEWDNFIQKHPDQIRDVRIDQYHVNSNGVMVGRNRPDIQMTLTGGKYTLPNGVEITVPAGQTRRVNVEFDNKPFTRVDDHFHRTNNNDPSSIQVFEFNDSNQMLGSLVYF